MMATDSVLVVVAFRRERAAPVGPGDLSAQLVKVFGELESTDSEANDGLLFGVRRCERQHKERPGEVLFPYFQAIAL